MNVENIKRVRDHIASLAPERFDMTDYFVVGPREFTMIARKRYATNASALEGSCGTAGCIAGHALALLDPDGSIPDDPDDVAAALLGLGLEQSMELFTPDGFTNDATMTDHAVRVLDHLLATGEVDWSIIDTPQPGAPR